MYIGFDELLEKINVLTKRVEEIEKKMWKNRNASIELAISMGMDDKDIVNITGASIQDIELVKIFRDV